MTARLALVRNDNQGKHAAPGHPERPDRIDAILAAIAADPVLADIGWLEPGPPTRDDVLLVHSEHEVRRVEAMAARGGGWFDPDTYCTPESYAIALAAAGCAVRAAGAVAGGETSAAFVLARPPGHHATVSTPMGFCLFNNAAIAVRVAQRQGVRRVAVIDIDVHHGNGSQEIFDSDASVLYCSLHQFPWYPGTGAASERGVASGQGTTLNVPVPAGTDGARWLELFDAEVAPAVDHFAPDLIVVSAGYDAHEDDPLAELRLSTNTYAAVAERIRRLAAAHCGGRSVWLLEGGYNLAALAASVRACLHALAAPM